jgi:uncharacterized protein YjbK
MPDVPSESEIKIALDQGETERLRGRLGEPVRRLRQVNHYYETAEDHFARARVSLRVREETDAGTDQLRLLLTVKEAGLRAGALLVRPEYESELSQDAWAAVKDGSMHFADLDLPPIHRLAEVFRKTAPDLSDLAFAELGSVPNVRVVFDFADESLSMEILLDRTTYPDGSEEFELECEIPPSDAGQGARVLRGLFEELEIDWRPSQVGKYVRFRRRIGRAVEDARE